MKNHIAYLVASFVLATSISYSQSLSDLFSKNPVNITWLGIDYSHVKLVGRFSEFDEFGSKGAAIIKDKYFPSWNNVVVKEKDKYNIGLMFRKNKYAIDISTISEINSIADTAVMESSKDVYLSSNEVIEFVSSYNFNVNEGIGVFFVAENLNKDSGKGSYHLVVMNMSTKTILLTDRFEGQAGGIGLRNFWLGSFFEVLDYITQDQYRVWKKEYGSK